MEINHGHYQTLRITKLKKSMKFILKCSECLMYRLFLLVETNYYDI